MIKVKRFFPFVVLLVIAGCGGSSSSDSPPSNPYGTLSISGSGNTISGAQYSPNFCVYSPYAYGATYTWTYNDGRSTDYRSVSVTSSGNTISVEFDASISGITYAWVASSATGVTIGSSSITLSNVTLAGHTNTTTSLTLNGTLAFL